LTAGKTKVIKETLKEWIFNEKKPSYWWHWIQNVPIHCGKDTILIGGSFAASWFFRNAFTENKDLANRAATEKCGFFFKMKELRAFPTSNLELNGKLCELNYRPISDANQGFFDSKTSARISTGGKENYHNQFIQRINLDRKEFKMPKSKQKSSLFATDQCWDSAEIWYPTIQITYLSTNKNLLEVEKKNYQTS